jgi:hypothetical protein
MSVQVVLCIQRAACEAACGCAASSCRCVVLVNGAPPPPAPLDPCVVYPCGPSCRQTVLGLMQRNPSLQHDEVVPFLTTCIATNNLHCLLEVRARRASCGCVYLCACVRRIRVFGLWVLAIVRGVLCMLGCWLCVRTVWCVHAERVPGLGVFVGVLWGLCMCALCVFVCRSVRHEVWIQID